MIARLDNGSMCIVLPSTYMPSDTSSGWSAPSAIGTAGVGFGSQAGAEVTDFLIVLNTRSVRASLPTPSLLALTALLSGDRKFYVLCTLLPLLFLLQSARPGAPAPGCEESSGPTYGAGRRTATQFEPLAAEVLLNHAANSPPACETVSYTQPAVFTLQASRLSFDLPLAWLRIPVRRYLFV